VSEAPAAGPVVLVADDNEAGRRTLLHLLEAEGYRVLEAAGGEQALALAAERHVDLALVDVLMPGVDGFQVARELRRQAHTRSTPILMVTGLSDLRNKVRGLEAGADDFLSKPYNRVELLARVASLLRVKALHDELESKNRLLERILSRYVSAEVAREVLRDPDNNLALGGQARDIAVLFADIRGFTSFAERNAAPVVFEVLNEVFALLTPVVMAHKGTFDKYIGDAVMCFFGAPLAFAEHARAAVAAAREMQVRFAGYRERRPEAVRLGLGIGIATGETMVGNLGTSTVMDYTAIGVVPNLASRLQSRAAPGEILIDEATRQQAGADLAVSPAASLHLKGMQDIVHPYRVLRLDAS